jgi:hypothetical protein
VRGKPFLRSLKRNVSSAERAGLTAALSAAVELHQKNPAGESWNARS